MGLLDYIGWRFPQVGRYDDRQLKHDLNEKVMDRLDELIESQIDAYSKTESDARYYTKTEIDAAIAGLNSVYAPVAHDHDSRYYTETEIDAAFAALSSVYAPASHNHDDRYYTESEVNTITANTAKTNVANTFTAAQTVAVAATSAQVKLERTGGSAGVGWIGADSANVLRVYDSAFSEKAAVTSTGRLKLANQPAFSAYNIAAVGSGTLVFTSTLANRDSVYNTGTGVFTAPEPGVYVFNASVFIDTASSTLKYGYINFQKNGVDTGPLTHSQYSATRSYETISLTQVLLLAAGDTVRVRYASGNSCLTYAGSYSSFSGFMLM